MFSRDALRTPVWLRVVIALAVPAVVFGVYVRFTGLQEIFCKSPDELAEIMPGLRLHGLPFFNIRAPLRYNFVQSLFYSQHGLGDVSFYYLASGALSLFHLPVAERFLYAAGGVTNLSLALAGGIFGAWLLGSAGTGWIFALLVLVSPFYVFVSRTGWGRLTWTPMLLLVLFLFQWKAMRGRGIGWAVAYAMLAGFISLTDGLVFLPLVLLLALFVPAGSLGSRCRQLAHDRVFLAALAMMSLGVAVDAAAGLVAWYRGTNLTLVAYLFLKGTHSALLPSPRALAATARAVDWYFPFGGAWIVVGAAFILAAVEGLRGRRIGFVAAWWFLAVNGALRYAGGLESAGGGGEPTPGWANAYILAVPSFLLVAWLIASFAEGRLPAAARVPAAARGIATVAVIVTLTFLLARQATVVAFATEPKYGVLIEQLANISLPRPTHNSCRALKAAAFYVRTREPRLPYVFHLTSDVYLGHIGEFYYGLSYGGSLQPNDPNHLLDFGLNQLHREYAPEAFYRPYGVEHFDYYIDFVEDPSAMRTSSLDRLSRDGARVVCTIWNDGRPIGRILSFHDQPPTDLDARTAAAAWDRTFGHARGLLLQPLAGTAYHFGYNWRPPE